MDDHQEVLTTLHDMDRSADEAQYATNLQLKDLKEEMGKRMAAIEAIVKQIQLDIITMKRTVKDSSADTLNAVNEVKKVIS